MTRFDIRQHVQFNAKGRAICPSCTLSKGSDHKNLNLAIVPDTDGAYKCHAGCTPDDIRSALGVSKDVIVPTALASHTPSKPVTVSPQQKKAAHETLMKSDGPAKKWLHDRGITDEMIARYELGITRSVLGKNKKSVPAIAIPFPNHDGTAYYQKKRVAPWLDPSEQPDGYQAWVQKGIPARTWFTWLPAEATETYLCEGEWDAMRLGWEMRKADKPIAVACFTCGCGTVPLPDQLDLLPGAVSIFYDRNDKPTKNGTIPGDDGARKVAAALSDPSGICKAARGKIALVPMPADCDVKGWDVSNALDQGYKIEDFIQAAGKAVAPQDIVKKPHNPLRDRLITNDELLARAPDYTEFLVPDLLTADELFVLAMPPRGGKSIFCMTLAKAVASGGKFLDRPVTQGSVLYVNLEDSETKVKRRQIAQGWGEGLPVYWLDKFKLSELDHLREIAEGIDDLRVIFLDTFSRIRDDGNKESSAELSRVLEPLQEMAKELGVCILFTHHMSKGVAEQGEDIFDLIRGSGAIRSTARGAIAMIPDNDCYRLIAENGYSDRADIKVRINPETLEWRLMGNWNPRIDRDMREQIIDHLNLMGEGTVSEIAAALNFNAGSVSTTLYRLQADDLVIKEGGRGNRPARYKRSANLCQQLDHVLAQPNVDGERATSLRQQKVLYGDFAKRSINSSGSINERDQEEKKEDLPSDNSSPQTGTSDVLVDSEQIDRSFLNKGNLLAQTANPDAVSLLGKKSSDLIDQNNLDRSKLAQTARIDQKSDLDTARVSDDVSDGLIDPEQIDRSFLKKGNLLAQGSNPYPASDTTPLPKKPLLAQIDANGESPESTGTRLESDLPIPLGRGKKRITLPLKLGDKVEIRSGQFTGKRVTVITLLPDGLIEVKNDRWQVSQKHERSNLLFLERPTATEEGSNE
ncbi:AAA family ATPase [Phormidesmis sp. 146-12]